MKIINNENCELFDAPPGLVGWTDYDGVLFNIDYDWLEIGIYEDSYNRMKDVNLDLRNYEENHDYGDIDFERYIDSVSINLIINIDELLKSKNGEYKLLKGTCFGGDYGALEFNGFIEERIRTKKSKFLKFIDVKNDEEKDNSYVILKLNDELRNLFSNNESEPISNKMALKSSSNKVEIKIPCEYFRCNYS
jgi:hypothetical protein